MPALGSMARRVEPEWLDQLPADDPGATSSRRDLRRINAWMGNASAMARALRGTPDRPQTGRLVEIGAGDGEFLLSVVRRLPKQPARGPRFSEAVLVDRQLLLREDTAACYAHFHWKVQAVQSDAMDYLANGLESGSTVVANLFLHHFTPEHLRHMLHALSRQTSRFIAIEPRRTRLGWFLARGLRWIGCHAVTRHDAPISVRAGFRDSELSQLWPTSATWSLAERRSGLFSHLFVARKHP